MLERIQAFELLYEAIFLPPLPVLRREHAGNGEAVEWPDTDEE